MRAGCAAHSRRSGRMVFSPQDFEPKSCVHACPLCRLSPDRLTPQQKNSGVMFVKKCTSKTTASSNEMPWMNDLSNIVINMDIPRKSADRLRLVAEA